MFQLDCLFASTEFTGSREIQRGLTLYRASGIKLHLLYPRLTGWIRFVGCNSSPSNHSFFTNPKEHDIITSYFYGLRHTYWLPNCHMPFVALIRLHGIMFIFTENYSSHFAPPISAATPIFVLKSPWKPTGLLNWQSAARMRTFSVLNPYLVCLSIYT